MCPEELGFPGGTRGKEPTCQCRRCKIRGLEPWVQKILCTRVWQPTPVFLPGESCGQRCLEGSQRVGHDLAALINTGESTEDLRHFLLTCLPSPSQKQDRSLFLSIMPSASHHEQRILPGTGWRDGCIKEFLPREQCSLFLRILLVHRILADINLNIYFL